MYLLFHDVYACDPRESGFVSPAADRYKLTVRQFERQMAWLAQTPGPPFELTFDDGGSSFYSQIADRLESRGWRAHCFVPTDYIGRPGFLTRQEIRELDERGHRIGSHSASHPMRFHANSRDVIADEWSRSLAVLQDLLGHAVHTASVPGGFYSRTVAELAAAAGVTELFTSEPVARSHRVGPCEVVGRFTIRRSSDECLAARLVSPAPWARWAMWVEWNAKAVIKPVLGPFYSQMADWLMAGNAAER